MDLNERRRREERRRNVNELLTGVCMGLLVGFALVAIALGFVEGMK